MVERLPHRLFRGHIRRSTRRAHTLRSAGAADHTRQAEVHNLHHSAVRDYDVRRFDIAMDDMPRVRFAEPSRHLASDIQTLLQGKAAAANFVRQRFTLVIPHDDEQAAICGFFQTVNHANIRVVQCRSSLRLARERLLLFFLHAEFRRKKFQRHRALETQIGGLIDHSHPAGAELPDDLEVADALAARNCCRGFCHGVILKAAVSGARFAKLFPATKSE